MDDIVKQAMAKWPEVPNVYGWLALDRRGQWRLKGDVVSNSQIATFINRNYEHDSEGRWFFQNGPQRVYVELEATPFIWRVDAQGAITSSARQAATLVQVYMDERGWPYLHTSLGFGLVHTQDVASLAQALELQPWPLEEIQASELPGRFGYQMSPAALEIKK